MIGNGQVRYARNGDVQLAFEELGGAGGDPLLLIMGLAVSRFWWPNALVREHYLPAAVYPQVADEVRALADRVAPTRAGLPDQP